eukprot:CAMPEP_0113549352 /NCGR_PEP_ID=MMETSP0015_2-20120614/13388_1 /TAXON_ID=2838 /ORGANISM="Odontella" /LENGTH=353 /DNA_ID=CAMNT_0000450057 /DNA_START=200 /DNA_END=1261 /DNA_ORIENTATION=+ /assembly_acc=CAM_ASM_000160
MRAAIALVLLAYAPAEASSQYSGGSLAFQLQRQTVPCNSDVLPSNVPKQTLAFPDDRTGVTVHLVGSMHYNPYSIAKASDIIRTYGENGSLGSVVVEQCPSRWERVQSTHPPGSPLRPFLDNEMQAAAEVGGAFGLPVILGDEEIEVVDEKMKDALKQTVKDIMNPFGGGWAAISNDMKTAWTEAVDPSWSSQGRSGNKEEGKEGPQFLSSLDLFDAPLLLASPVSFIRYPLAILIKTPLQGLVLFSILTFLTINGPAELMADNAALLSHESATDIILDVFGGFGAFALETVLLSRVFLTVLLIERNEVLAKNIRSECVRLSKDSSGTGKVCVAVLGMAHCNGVKNILCSGKT